MSGGTTIEPGQSAFPRKASVTGINTRTSGDADLRWLPRAGLRGPVAPAVAAGWCWASTSWACVSPGGIEAGDPSAQRFSFNGNGCVARCGAPVHPSGAGRSGVS